MSAIATTVRTIQITEIKANNFPQAADYRYRCSVTLHSDDDGQTKLQKSLLTRLQPNWLIDIKYKGDCYVKVKISYRTGDITNPWQDLETVEFATQEVLNEDKFKELEFAISSWDVAPELKIGVNVNSSQTSLNNNKLNILTSTKDDRYHQQKRKNSTKQSEDETPIELPTATTLSPPEVVIVKDVWNKLRAWKELEMEQFFKRLLLEEPELEYLFDEAIDSIGDYFFDLFDCCVRQLTPQTQNVINEPMMGVPPEKGDGLNSVEEYGALFADIGMQPKHWLKARQVWMWMLPSIPYLEEYDRENLSLGSDSALDKFFNTHVILPMVEAIDRYQLALSSEMLLKMADSWTVFSNRKHEMGMEFYQILFHKYPSVLPIFGRADMDYLSLHLFESLEFLVRCLKAGSSDAMLRELRMLGQLHGKVGVPSSAYPAISDTMFVLFEKYVPDFNPELKQAWQTLFDRVTNIMKLPKINEERLLKKARRFLDIISQEQGWSQEARLQRWQEIESQVQATGTYTHSYEELAYGAQLSWRNASKCIARIQWSNMIVRDCRQVTEPDEMFKQLEEHLRLATNGGNIQIVMSVFRPKLPKERWGPRIWNSQLIRYAAYPQPDGSVLGDRANLDLTEAIIELGWQPPAQKSHYDILPLVIEIPGKKPQIYEWNKEDVLEVPITHPSIPEFESLDLRWYAIPAISNFRMDIGGITYGCLPFNGWYMETELSRDFLEDWRYDRMDDVAKLLNLDTSAESTLWRDRVALETNVAILHSFQKAKVSMVDHQSASRQFLSHDLREKKSGRECPADYGWVVPPSGGSTCPVWHHQMRDFYLDPAYHHGADRWAVEKDIDLEQFITIKQEDDDQNDRILILYASETGTAEGFARKSSRQLQQHNTQVMALDEYDIGKISQEKLLLVITSTFGNGSIPSNGRKFLQWLNQQQKTNSLSQLNYAVLGIGSTVYEHFCAAGISIDKGLRKAGANSIVPLHKADEIKGQANTFKQWLGLISRVLGDDLNSSATSINAPKLEVTFLDNLTTETLAIDSDKGVRVPLVANKELLGKVVAGSRSTRYIAFDISKTELNYETGDHLSILPCNSSEIVDRLCTKLDLNPEAYFTASYVTSDGTKLEDELPIQLPTTVRQVLTEELDLSLREPLEELLTYLNSVVTNPQEKNTLTTWLEIITQANADEDSKNLTKSLIDKFMTVVDLFDQFPSATIDLGSLLEILPQQKPRLYSISSSNLLHPDKIQITVGVLQIKTDAGKIRQGLCSNYLANLEPQQTARIGVNTSSFRPPEDPHAPILMVGPGTGISPLIAFMEYRQALLEQRQTLGEAHLYFGCRNHDDFIYREHLKQWRKTGVLTYIAVAFSRLKKQKAYVQHLMEKKPAQVWKILSNPQCHYYVCGDAKMADNVFDTMFAIAKSQGKMSHLEAVDFFDNMKREKRFNSDVWGVTLNYQKAIKQVQQDNYSKAEKWLESVQT